MRLAGIIVLLLAAVSHAAQPEQVRMVEAQTKPGKPWKAFPTRLLEDVPENLSENRPSSLGRPSRTELPTGCGTGPKNLSENRPSHLERPSRTELPTGSGTGPKSVKPQLEAELDQYGGQVTRRAKATGFFYPAKIDGRWWLVDPDGGLFIHVAIAGVTTVRTPEAEAALARKFGDKDHWAASATDMLRQHAFNGTGAWSDTTRLRSVQRPMAYTRIWNFMASYGKQRGGTYQSPGHTGYPGDCIFVFDPEFEPFCDRHARQLAEGKNDPWLLGHFSDNEMPLTRSSLKNFLQLPEGDAGRLAAERWLKDRHGPHATIKDVTEQDLSDFRGVVVERYYRIVSQAIKRYDPNHLYLGSRFYGRDLERPEIFRAAGPYVDVVAVNYYRAWTPDPERLAMWERESKRPILITEWYAKGVDSGMPNTSGAGWTVRTQRDRGCFYQNFTLGLLESRVCVGWHWFKYADNDPADTKADPSNLDANKGIVTARYEPYPALLEAMNQLNQHVYPLIDYFDRGKQ